jgi:iron complex outermembrane receptor protein
MSVIQVLIWYRNILVSGIVILCPQWIVAQANYSIRGYVYSGKEPVVGASVFLHETRQGTSSSADGFFDLVNAKQGTYTLYVTSVGYEAYVTRITVPGAENLVINLQESVHSLDEVVVEGNVFRQTQRESSVSIENVTAKEIAKNSGTTLMNSLERLPGISSINMGVGVSKPVIRGMSFNRVVVNDSGIKQEGQQWGSDHGLEIDQFNVENIEIIRGPASLAYGSDALGGVLNIQHPLMKQPGQHEGGVNLFFRSNNNTAGTTVFGTGNSKGVVYKMRFSGLSYADYKVPATEFHYNRFVLPIYDNKLKNTAGRELHGSALIGVQRSWGYSHITFSNFNQKVGIFSGAMGIPRAYQLTPDNSNRDVDLPSQDVNHFKIISNNSIKLGQKWLEVDIGYQKNTRKEYSNPHAHGSGDVQHGTLALQLDLHTLTANARLQTTHNKHQNVLGLQSSLQKNISGGYEFLIPDYNSRQAGVFMLHQYRLNERTVINGGLRADVGFMESGQVIYPFYYENNFVDSIERSPDVNRNFFNYSAGIGISYEPNTQNNFKFNFGKTFRTPTPPELTANGMHHGTFRYEVGDPNLDPEQGFQFDAVWTYTKKNIRISVTPFYNYFSNYIYLSPSGVFPTVEIDEQLYPVAESGQMYTFRQTSAIHTGAEMQVNWQANNVFDLTANSEYVWAQNLITLLPLPFTPPATFQLIAEVHWPGVVFLKNIFINLNAGYYMAQKRVERNEPATSSYQLLNVSSGFNVGKKELLNISFNIQNLLDRKYLNHLSRYRILNLPEPGRSFIVNVGYKIEKSKGHL